MWQNRGASGRTGGKWQNRRASGRSGITGGQVAFVARGRTGGKWQNRSRSGITGGQVAYVARGGKWERILVCVSGNYQKF